MQHTPNAPDPAGGTLHGLTVVVTRAAAQQASLAEALREAGATVVGLSTIAIAPPADGGAALAAAVRSLGEYRWVVLTSTNGARAFLDARGPAPSPVGPSVAAVGASTAGVLSAAGLTVDLIPDAFRGEALLEAFPLPPPEGSRRVLLVRAEVATDVLPLGLAAAGWDPHIVDAYRTVRAELDQEALAAAAGADVVLFASPSSVQRFMELTDGRTLSSLPAIVIGAVTEAAARAAGFEVAGVAQRSDVSGLVDAVRYWAADGRRR